MITVEVADRQRALAIDLERIRSVVQQVLRGEGVGRASISVALVDNPTIHRLNARFLGHDEPTDVLSFPLGEPGDEELSGELVVSGEMAVEVARREGWDPQAEGLLYVIHGLLHLCGYGDLDPAETPAMRRREAEWLTELGIEHQLAPGPSGSMSEARETFR